MILEQDIELLIHDWAGQNGLDRVNILAKETHTKFYEAAGYTTEGPLRTKPTMQPQGPPKNIDELLSDLDNISAMQDAIFERFI